MKTHHWIAAIVGAYIGWSYSGTLKSYPVFAQVNGLINSNG